MAQKKQINEIKYKAKDKDQFANLCNKNLDGYEELCKGKSVVLDIKNEDVKNLLNNNLIVKE